ncbi:hypothetical protein N665_0532s0071, partial [Sinapis alba]
STPERYSLDEGADILNQTLLSLFWRVLLYKDFHDVCLSETSEADNHDRRRERRLRFRFWLISFLFIFWFN